MIRGLAWLVLVVLGTRQALRGGYTAGYQQGTIDTATSMLRAINRDAGE